MDVGPRMTVQRTSSFVATRGGNILESVSHKEGGSCRMWGTGLRMGQSSWSRFNFNVSASTESALSGRARETYIRQDLRRKRCRIRDDVEWDRSKYTSLQDNDKFTSHLGRKQWNVRGEDALSTCLAASRPKVNGQLSPRFDWIHR